MQSDLAKTHNDRRNALIERIGNIADLCCEQPLSGELGDVAYDLLRQAAAQISSDALQIGKLIALPDDAAGRMAELQLAAFLAGRGSVTSMKNGTRAAKPGPTMDDYRRMAQAALTTARAQVEGENHRLREDLLAINRAIKAGPRIGDVTALSVIAQIVANALESSEHRKEAP